MVADSDAWQTPPDVAEALGPFSLDVCSVAAGTAIRAADWYHLDGPVTKDGLLLPWYGNVFCNPPYSNPRLWCDRLAAYQAGLHLPGPAGWYTLVKAGWCALVKLDPTTRWWATLLNAPTTTRGAVQWAPFRKRLRFVLPEAPTVRQPGAKFTSALVWGGGWRLPDAMRPFLWLPED